MGDFRCTTDKYDLLYARWLENPGTLLDLAGWEPGQRLLDLCGGTGAVTKESLRRGADERDIVLVDLNPRLEWGTRVRQVALPAEDMASANLGQFDVVVCRQAMAYLDLELLAKALVQVVKPGGIFVFNTFARPRWKVRWYTYNNRLYLEASAYLWKWVWHLQTSWSLGWDMTLFKWHKEDTISHVFSKHGFQVEISKVGKTQYWNLKYKGSNHA